MSLIDDPHAHALPCALLSIDTAGRIVAANARAHEWTGLDGERLQYLAFTSLFCEAPAALFEWIGRFAGNVADSPEAPLEIEAALKGSDAQPVPVAVRLEIDSRTGHSLCVMSDLRSLHELEFKLGQAQQMESVGRIAAGIAHEINTPVQFIGDSVSFLGEAFSDLMKLLDAFEHLRKAARSAGFEPEVASSIEAIAEEADMGFMREEIPASLDRTVEGVSRVADIARAIKEFSYPEQREKEATDINAALLTTLTIARSEYKYVAEIETDLGELPPVFCHAGHLNQVFLNLIVNAAHAIEAKTRGSDEKGMIRIRTRSEGGTVSIRITDTGCGIPRQIRTRVFDAFFTTKEVGRGTGQGLALARSVIVDKHAGTLSFESEVGAGTCFEIRLPIDGHSHDTTPQPETSEGSM